LIPSADFDKLSLAEADPTGGRMNLSKSIGSLCKTDAVLRAGDQIFAAR
jgi:hypothetical protein